jgi:hypothetical protein
MRIKTIRNVFYYCFILGIMSHELKAQDQNLSLIQDVKFANLLAEKRKINATITVNDRYKIQVFSGAADKAKKILNDCKQDFANLDGTLVFNTPNYKVWVGNFRTRIEAERNLLDIRKKYENAYLIKPQK